MLLKTCYILKYCGVYLWRILYYYLIFKIFYILQYFGVSRENVEENLRADSVAALQDIYSDLVNISIFYIHHHIHIHVHILYTYIIHTPGQYILFLYIPHHHISIISIIYLFGPGQYIHLLYFYIYPPGQYIHCFIHQHHHHH